MIKERIALLYKDKEQGKQFMWDKFLEGEIISYDTLYGRAIVWEDKDMTSGVEYILCECTPEQVRRRFCGMHLSGYIVTDPDEMYHGEPLLFVASRVRKVE